MLDAPEVFNQHLRRALKETDDVNGFRRRPRTKPSRYEKEKELAKQRQAEIEAKNRAREEREKERRAMAKARRPAKDGKPRLGRQSKVLLSRVQRLVSDQNG